METSPGQSLELGWEGGELGDWEIREDGGLCCFYLLSRLHLVLQLRLKRRNLRVPSPALSSSFLPCDLNPPLPTPSCLSLAQTSLLGLQPQEKLESIRYHPLGCRLSGDMLSLRHLCHQGDILWAVECLGLGLRGPEGRSEEQ